MEKSVPSIVVLYPDYLGEGLTPGGFADRLLADGRRVVALVNGPDPNELKAPRRTDVDAVLSPVSGLAPSLRYGYRAAATLADVVVRVDTAETPTDRIEQLAQEAWSHGGAIGDLVFNTVTLRQGSADELAQLDVFPTMFDKVTGGRLVLTGAHGFQAWTSGMLTEVLPLAEQLWDAAAAHGPMRWGFDAAMALAGDMVGRTPTVVRYPATSMRDRNRSVIAEQHDAVLRVILEYLRQR